jgi:hypothetical protein
MLYFFLLYVKKKYILDRYENEWAVKIETICFSLCSGVAVSGTK